MVAARYQIADKLPERPDIWHSLPDSSDSLRERDEDIRSRPLYANEVGAGALVHIHTNASDNPSARGTRVFHHMASAESSRLGSMILCYMRESIHSLDQYKDFPIDSASTPGNHGENRLAAMPSVIVEVGFHTNAEDAAALKDIFFMGHSMAGVAKGYRLFEAGEKCLPLKIDAPVRAEGMVDDNVVIPVSAQGFPDFPLAIQASRKNCARRCAVDYELADNPDEMAEIKLAYRCDEARVELIELTARDFSGVEAEPIEVSITCHPKPEP
ncbi:N-acetylmuramoyl-L-alanine amidase [Luteibacter yeojuensis]